MITPMDSNKICKHCQDKQEQGFSDRECDWVIDQVAGKIKNKQIKIKGILKHKT